MHTCILKQKEKSQKIREEQTRTIMIQNSAK